MLCSSPKWLCDVGSAMAYAVILPGRWGLRTWTSFAVLCPLLFALWSCSSLWGFFVCVVSVVEVAVLLLFRLLFFVVCLAAFPLLSSWSSCSWLSRWIPWLPGAGCGVVLALRVSFVPGFCLRGARLWYFCRVRRGYVFWPFFAAFSELRGARQVERFAQCSFRHLGQVVFHLAGSFGFFLVFAAPDPGGC